MTSKMKTILLGLTMVLGISMIQSCSSDKPEERTAADATSALVHENDKIAAFGHLSLLGILDKTGYQKIPKVNVILGDIVGKWKKGFKLDEPMYYALETPLANDGTPACVYAMITVNNQDSLREVMSEMGYELEKSGDISFFQENDVTFGMRNNLFMVISKKAPYDGKAAITGAFKQTEGELSEGKAATILAKKGDIVTGVSLERFYANINPSQQQISEIKKKELGELLADGFFESNIQFENGKMTITTANLISDELKEKLFFKDNNGDEIQSKLGPGKPWMGLSYNIDMRKLESFINEYMPAAQKEISKQLPSPVNFGMMALGSNAYSKLFSGQFGMVALGNPKSMDGMELDFNAYLGLGSSDIIRNLLAENMMGAAEKKGDSYVIGNMYVTSEKDGIYVSKDGPAKKGKLSLPAYAANFGKSSFTMFIAFDQIDMASFDLDEGMKVVEILESLNIEGTKDGMTMVITTKSKKDNILKQVADFYANSLMEKMAI